MSFVLCFYFLWPTEINARGDEKQEISLVWPYVKSHSFQMLDVDSSAKIDPGVG